MRSVALVLLLLVNVIRAQIDGNTPEIWQEALGTPAELLGDGPQGQAGTSTTKVSTKKLGTSTKKLSTSTKKLSTKKLGTSTKKLGTSTKKLGTSTKKSSPGRALTPPISSNSSTKSSKSTKSSSKLIASRPTLAAAETTTTKTASVKSSVKLSSVKSSSIKSSAKSSVKSTSVKSTSVKATSVKSVKSTSVKSTSVKSTSVKSTSVKSTSVKSTSVKSTSVKSTSVKSTSVKSTSVKSTSVKSTSVKSTSVRPLSVNVTPTTTTKSVVPTMVLTTTTSSFMGTLSTTETTTTSSSSSSTTSSTRGIPTLCSTALPAGAYNPTILQQNRQVTINGLQNTCTGLCARDAWTFTGGLTISQSGQWMCECAGTCFAPETRPLAAALLNPVESANAQVCMRVANTPWFSLDGVYSLQRVAAHPGEPTMPKGLTSAKAYCSAADLGGCLTELGETSMGGVALSVGLATGTQVVGLANRYAIPYTLDTSTSYNASCICVSKGADCRQGVMAAKTNAPGPSIASICVGYILFSSNCVSNREAQAVRYINCQERCRALGGFVNRAFWGTYPGISCGRPDRESANVCECLLPSGSSSCGGADRWFPNGIPGMIRLTVSSAPSVTVPSTSVSPSPSAVALQARQATRGAATGWYRNSYYREPTLRNFSPSCTNLEDKLAKCRVTCTNAARGGQVDAWQTTSGGVSVVVPGILGDAENGSPVGMACWDEAEGGKRKGLWCQCLN